MTDFVAEIANFAEIAEGRGIRAAPRASATEGTEEELRSLLRWLNEDETLDVRGRVSSREPSRPDHMGIGFDVLQLAVGSGLSTASLVVSVLQWQSSRRRAPAVILRRGEVEVMLTQAATGDEETLRGMIDLLDGLPATPLGVPAPRTEEPGGDDGTP